MAENAAPTRAATETESDAALTDELTDEDLEIVAGAGGLGPPPGLEDLIYPMPSETLGPFDWFA